MYFIFTTHGYYWASTHTAVRVSGTNQEGNNTTSEAAPNELNLG